MTTFAANFQFHVEYGGITVGKVYAVPLNEHVNGLYHTVGIRGNGVNHTFKVLTVI
jgi:hypothetical protein